ncbi:DinB family protein [Bacillus haimaensis]|uniref:DinB family protein n=1 Tax=Bacillus haimaensis TaxID=3160967 RepID=UPI003AA7E1F7
MLKFFQYNWQVRDEWFEWCRQLPDEEMLKERIGGMGGILYTFFHIIDVEYSWICGIQGKDDVVIPFEEYNTLDKVLELSEEYRQEILAFLQSYSESSSDQRIQVAWNNDSYSKAEILHHVIAHEIHHIGQISVWAREMGLKPVSANFIGRDLG